MKPSSCPLSSGLEDLRREEDVVVESARDVDLEVSSSSVRLLSDRDDTSDPFLDLSDFDLGILTSVVTQYCLRSCRYSLARGSKAIMRCCKSHSIEL